MIHKEAANAHNNLNALEEQVIICRWHEKVIWDWITKSLGRKDSRRGLQPQPFLLLEIVELIPRKWIVLEKCAFYGLRFFPTWVVWLVQACLSWLMCYISLWNLN
jgi:hypothetical protein